MDSETLDIESSDGKPLVLAAWTSLQMARMLGEFCESEFETIEVFDFDVVSVESLNTPELLPHRPADYRAVMFAFSERDAVPDSVTAWLESWAHEHRKRNTEPLIICREGIFDDEVQAHGVESPPSGWHSLMDRMEADFEASVIWDRRIL